MRNYTFLIFALTLLSTTSLSSKLSPDLQIIVDLYSQGKIEEIKNMSIISTNQFESREYIDIIAEFDSEPNLEILNRCKVLKRYPGKGNFYHLRLPISELGYLAQVASLKYAKLSKPLKLFLDKVREKIGIEKFYNYSYIGDIQGKDVIIGVVDTGIDTSRLDFWKSSFTPRILYIWDQTQSGKKPQGFDYGNEITSGDIISNPKILKDEVGHGTHVAGIAGGNGNESFGKYKGMAPSSEFIIVKSGQSLGEILDGISYILNKAKTIGKPCVVNLSLGSDIGSHDGKDIESQILKDIIGYYGKEGNIIVAAAGNSGDLKIHYSNSVNSVVPSVAVIKVESNSQEIQDQIYIDSWFDFTAPGVEIRVTTPNSYTTGWLPFPSSYSISTPDGQITISSSSNKYNGSGNIYIVISDSTTTKIKEGNWSVGFRTTSGTTLLHSWMMYSDGVRAYFVNGDNYFSISSPFLLDEVIIVGAFTTKTNINSIYGNVFIDSLTNDNICFFSSLGPTRDNRQKPDIAAPGALIVSVSSSSAYANPSFVVNEYSNKYVAMMGTSMSTPVVTGISALLLSIDRKLTSQDIINYLKTYSLASPYDQNGKSWDPYWGFGMLNITNIIETLRSPSNLVWLEGNVLRFSQGKNQFNIKIRTDNQDLVEAYLYNIRGALIKSLGIYQIYPGINTIQINIKESEIPKDNIYILKLYGKTTGARDFKIIVLR